MQWADTRHKGMNKFFTSIATNPYIFAVSIASAICLYGLNEKSLWLDEVLTVRIAGLDWDMMWRTLTTTEPYRWLYYVILHIWMRYGTGDSYYRALSVIIGLTGIPGIYKLGEALYSSKVGRISALLLAVHPIFIRYAQEIHSYSLLLSLSIWSSYMFVMYFRRPGVRTMSLYILSSLLMVYSHHFGVLVIAAHYVFLLGAWPFRMPFRWIMFSSLALMVGMSPFVIFPIPIQNLAWVSYPTADDIWRFICLLFGGHEILVVSFAILITHDWTRYKTSAVAHSSRILLFVWLLFPIVFVFFVTYVFRPIFVSRYMIIVLPPCLLLAGHGLSRFSDPTRRMLLVGTMGIMIAGTLYWHTGSRWYAQLGFTTFSEKEDWRGASIYIRNNSTSNDRVIFYPYFVRYPFEYYWNKISSTEKATIEEFASAPYTIGGAMPEPSLKGLQTDESRRATWLVLSHHRNVQLGRMRQANEIIHSLNALYKYKDEVQYDGVFIIHYYDQKK